jgi:tetratricopeptide (TPR) repeat protein
MLMQQIKDSDIANMSDSTLFEYYYLAGWYSYVNENFENQIDYLVKAKEICETKLGINKNVFMYFEIIKAIGEACEELDKDDEALLWYEEGLIKGLPYLETDAGTLQSYLMDIRTYIADIYENKGYADIAKYLRGSKPLNYEGSFEYAFDLMMRAEDLNLEGQSIAAIELLDEAKRIFKRFGQDGNDMLQPLYRRYLRCYTSLGYYDKIDKLLKTKKYMFQGENESYLIYDISEIINICLFTHHDIKAATKYYEYLTKEYDKSNEEDYKTIINLGNNLNYYADIYNKIDSLEHCRASLTSDDYNWGIFSFQLSNLLIKVGRQKEGNEICENVYNMSSKLKDDPQNLHWFILMNLADYYNQIKELNKAERYLKEQLSWLDSKKIPADSEERGWVYNKLGIAYLNGKLYKEGSNMLIKAENILLPIYGHQSQEYATILHNKGRLAQLEGKFDEAKQYLEEAVKIQIELDGKAMDRTTQYLDEVNHSIKVHL